MSETLQKLNQFDLDLTGRIRLKSNRHPGWMLAAILAHSGDSWLWATGVGLVWLFSFGRQPLHRTSAIFEISIVVQALTVFALKALTQFGGADAARGPVYQHGFARLHPGRAVQDLVG